MTARSFGLALLSVGLCACASRSPLPAPQTPLTKTPATVLREPPALSAPANPQTIPDIKKRKLDNGVTVYVVEQHALPHVALAYVNLRAGEDPSSIDDAGLASLVNQMLLVDEADLDDPTEQEDSKGTPEPQPDRAVTYFEFSAHTGRHTSYIRTQVEASEVGGAVDALADMVRAPRLDAAVFEVAKKRVQSQWDGARYSLRGLARNYLMQRIYGPVHVLGQYSEWAVKHIDAFPLSRVVDSYRARYVPEASALLVVGDVDAEQVQARVEGAFGDWHASGEAPARYAPSDWQPRGKRKIFLGDRGARLAAIAVGQRAPAPASKDFAAFEVLTHVLGGSFASRLMTTLRAGDGLTYSVDASLVERRDGSTLLIETSVPEEHAKHALERILGEMRRLQQEPIDASELSRAKAALIQRALLQYETTSGALSALSQALELGEPPETAITDYIARVRATTIQEVRAAAVDSLLPTQAPVIVIGDMMLGSDLQVWSLNDDETF